MNELNIAYEAIQDHHNQQAQSLLKKIKQISTQILSELKEYLDDEFEAENSSISHFLAMFN